MNDCFKIFDINLVEQSTLTPSSENALFPASNIKDARRSKVFRAPGNSANLILDFQETSEINGIFIVADKRNGFGVSTVTIEFNGTSNFTTPAHTVTVPLSVKFGIGFISFDTIEYRFARIVMTSTLGYCELANVFIGKEIEMERTISFGWTVKDQELSTKSYNRYGQLFVDVILRQKQFAMTFKNMNKEDLNALQTLLDRVGESKPFYIMLGNDKMVVDYRRYSGPVYFEDIPTEANPLFGRYTLPTSLREVT
jgi:hypothetical protein